MIDVSIYINCYYREAKTCIQNIFRGQARQKMSVREWQLIYESIKDTTIYDGIVNYFRIDRIVEIVPIVAG